MPLGSLGATQLSETDTGISHGIRRSLVGPRPVGAGGPSVSGVGSGGSRVEEAAGAGDGGVAVGLGLMVAVAAIKARAIVAVSKAAFPNPAMTPDASAGGLEVAVGRPRPGGAKRSIRAPQRTDRPSRDSKPEATRHPQGRFPLEACEGFIPGWSPTSQKHGGRVFRKYRKGMSRIGTPCLEAHGRGTAAPAFGRLLSTLSE